MLVLFTPPHCNGKFASKYNHLFEEGLHALILRLKGATLRDYEELLLAINPKYHCRVLIDNYFELLQYTTVGGVYLNPSKWDCYDEVRNFTSRVATSAHSLEELAKVPFTPTFAMLSPVYDSISKSGYKAALSLEECKMQLPHIPFPVLALGGITPTRYKEVLNYGFAGAATLGYVYESAEGLLSAFRRFPLPEVLSVGGHDPSGGAGIVADSLTISRLGAVPLTVPTALTVQNEKCFKESIAIPRQQIEAMLQLLFEAHPVKVAKIGLTSSLEDTLLIAQLLKQYGVHFVIWDPVLKPSKGNALLWEQNKSLIEKITSFVDLITPNQFEAEMLWGNQAKSDLSEVAKAHATAILVTGQATKKGFIEDSLYTGEGKVHSFYERETPYDKHGTGCALSSYIATRIAQGYSLEDSCRAGQKYVALLRSSSPSLLGDYRVKEEDRKNLSLQQVALQYITNSSSSEDILQKAKQYLDGGGRWIQLRMKKASHEERVATAKRLKQLLRNYARAVLIIDDDVEAVLKSNADGVHLGLEDCGIAEARKKLGWGKIIGGTCNKEEDIRRRAIEGADYIGVGPFRTTQTKEKLSPLLGGEGLQRLASFNKQLPFPIPLVGIGGIIEEDLPLLSKLEIDGVALSSTIESSNDIQATVQHLQKKIATLWHIQEI